MRRIVAPLAVVLAVGCAAVVAAAGVRWSGADGPDDGELPRAGDLVEFAGPVLRSLGLTAGTMATALLLTVLVLQRHGRDGSIERNERSVLRTTSWALAAWAGIAGAQSLVASAYLLAVPIPQLLAGGRWSETVAASGAVRGWVVVAVLAGTAAAICATSTTVIGPALALLLALGAVVQPTLNGHGGGTTQHAVLLATTGIHGVAAVLWAGMTGALWLALLHPRVASPDALRRQRRVSTVAAAMLILSGLGNGVAQVGSPSDLLATGYGQLVLLKLVLTSACVAVGLTLARALAGDGLLLARRGLTARAGLETVVLLVTMGVGSALALSPPTRTADPLSTAGERAAGFAFPPVPDWHSVVLELRPDAVFFLVTVALAVTYALGLARLRRRGHHWPPGRSVAWFSGVALLFWLTNFGIARYANVAPGFHMGQHMVLTMLVPILLVLGAPVTLALRALHPGQGGQWGPREWLVRFLGSRALAILTQPAVVLVLYVSGLYGLYLTSAFATLMSSHTGHVLMQAHFLVSGYLFYWILIGTDPRPQPLPYLYRFVVMMIASALHGFFAVVIMMSGRPLAPEWFALVRPPWIEDLLSDTTMGGQLAWAMGELPLALVAVTLAVQWSRDEDRQARRLDRRAERTGDADLRAYNAYLAALATGERRTPGRPPADT